jgi:predicted transcriptional regulator
MIDKKGKKNPSYNHNIYTFHNELKNKHFTGTKREFSEKYNINMQNIYKLFNGKWKQTFGWKLFKRI